MGLQSIKEKLQLGDNAVCEITDNKITIGVAYIPELLVLDRLSKKVFINDNLMGSMVSAGFKHAYDMLTSAEEKTASIQLILEMAATPDEPTAGTEVVSLFTCDIENGLIEHACEAGKQSWPHNTLAGRLIRDNFFKTKEEAVEYAIKNTTFFIDYLNKAMAKKLEEITGIQKELKLASDFIGYLNAMPTPNVK